MSRVAPGPDGAEVVVLLQQRSSALVDKAESLAKPDPGSVAHDGTPAPSSTTTSRHEARTPTLGDKDPMLSR